MSSGRHILVENTQERAISSDINRLQKFEGKDLAELLRYWLNVTGNDDLNAGSVITEPASSETPLRAEIINGLLVRPQTASTSVFVDPGVAMLMSPDAAPDESNYKYIRDVGMSAPGTLVIAPGAVATRIDVVECKIDPIEATSTESRDVFDPVTGLFTATALVKERQGRLEYRVRSGIAGAGYPGNAAGWLPLMVASVPSAAVNNDTVTFWDVRPLISDREFAATALVNDLPTLRGAVLTGNFSSFNPECRVSGVVDAVFRGRRVGGRIRRGTPGADADYIDVASLANQDAAIAFGGGGYLSLYLAFPFGLPRWARYSTAAPYLPRSPRGIPVASLIAPTLLYGTPSVALSLPASTGLAGSVTNAFAVTTVRFNTIAPDFAAADKFVYPNQARNRLGTDFNNATEADFDLVAGTDFPLNARIIAGEINLRFSAVANGTFLSTIAQVILLGSTAVTGAAPGMDFRIGQYNKTSFMIVNNSGVVQNVRVHVPFEFALPQPYPSTTPVNLRIAVVHGMGLAADVALSAINISRYSIGP